MDGCISHFALLIRTLSISFWAAHHSSHSLSPNNRQLGPSVGKKMKKKISKKWNAHTTTEHTNSHIFFFSFPFFCPGASCSAAQSGQMCPSNTIPIALTENVFVFVRIVENRLDVSMGISVHKTFGQPPFEDVSDFVTDTQTSYWME